MFEELWTGGWPSFAAFDRLREEMDSLFDSLDGQALRAPSAGAFPPINVGETSRDVRVYVLTPGLDASEVGVSLQGNLLTVEGRRVGDVASESGNPERTWYRNERFQGEFRRTVLLPDTVDPERVEARARDGVISIVIGKRQETQPRSIEVKAE